MQFRLALLSATVLAAPLAFSHVASAQPVTGPYIAGGVGLNLESNTKLKDINVGGTPAPYEGRLVMTNGWTGQFSAGYGFGDGFRVELEGDYIQNSFEKVKIAGTQLASTGREARYGVFTNGYYDFNLGIPYLFPYIGAGVGWQEIGYNGLDPAGSYFQKQKGSLAYQGIAGLAIPIPGVPGLSGTVEYRLIGMPFSRKYDGSYGPNPAQFKSLNEYDNEVLVGVRYQLFNAPPPAPPAPAPAPAPVAAPAPAPSKTYLVFFDWDKSDLTPRATQIIAEAASDSKSQSTTTIEVSGYTDTSGTPDYNMGLSERRAEAVEGQLVADGVAQSEIEIHAYGETHLLVPTGPGVREPQNRRVEIVLD